MMPTIYVYFGIRVFFWGNEHSPIHVHGRYQDKESKAEIFIEDGAVADVRFRDVAGRPPLAGKQLRDFKDLVIHEADIEPKWITRRIK